MKILEILLIVGCVLFVGAVTVVAFVRKKRGGGCDCCSDCSNCCHCAQSAQQKSKK